MALPEPGDWSSIIFVPSLEKLYSQNQLRVHPQ